MRPDGSRTIALANGTDCALLAAIDTRRRAGRAVPYAGGLALPSGDNRPSGPGRQKEFAVRHHLRAPAPATRIG